MRKNFLTTLRHAATVSIMAVGSLAAGPAAAAEAWPARPIRMIVPFAPGGATDTLGRLVAHELAGVLKQSVVVENKPGAGGNIGSNLVAKAVPDGYTLLFGAAGNISINPSLFNNMPYDAEKDLVPAGLVSQSMNVLVVPAALPVNSVTDLVEYASQHPDATNYGSSGNGGTTHLAGELFNSMAGTHITHVPYQGSGPAMIDLLAGRLQLMFDNLPSAMPHIQRGELKALGVTSDIRSPQLPDVPTIAQTGLPGFEATTWFGVFAPAGTPDAVLERLNGAINQVMQTAPVQEKLDLMAAYFTPTTRAQFQALIRSDTEKWARVIKEADIKLN
ncbi:tripartite tricarboxylate transporter substrate binding protein [Bordetella sp. BOR01]|uniref:tripartite tricarboxylate transporter substrate binding protein n=1 Tax=Bordetella sp. BOR01 TaxID=2854779 RepID=UPI001C47D01E|nr:tripartite tricarboxylate transporter substrate binding protein [Bordetella sp. BOR01]MBV7484066.1 tripartite tricarboxylate transporter substrate binding protein [Bordetella sp. BOR01]